MNYQYYIADVFTNQLFNGAQVAVFPDADGLNKQQMAAMANELHLSESVFIFRQKGDSTALKMRVFSPLGELDFAGHPVIAAAYVLAATGAIEVQLPHTPLTLIQNTGPVPVNVTWKDGHPKLIQFSRQVTPVVDYFAPDSSELAAFLGIEATHIDHKQYSPRLVSCGFPYLVVPVYYAQTVRQARFNYEAWSQSIAPQTAAQEILLFSPRSPSRDSDFSARLVGPNISLREDPPVGSAMPAFAAYLCSFSHLQTGTYTFAVERGAESSRRSILHLEMDHKSEETLTVRVGGEAVMAAQGHMNVPES